MASRISRVGRHGGGDAAGEYGDKSQQGRHSHRTGSFKGEFGMWLSSSHGEKTELALLDGDY
jgi:hypothetical protein